MSYPVISLQNICKAYRLSRTNVIEAVKNVSLDVLKGEFVILFGPSGCGKSTLLNIIAGLDFATSGKVMIRHRNLIHLNSARLARYHRTKIGIVFQAYNLIKSLNVWENVALSQVASGVALKARKEHAMALLKVFNLDSKAYRHINELSGGEQQSVAIARALLNHPLIILLDEPTGNLDTKSASKIIDYIRKLNSEANHTILMVTHNPNYIPYATRVVYMEDGRIVREINNTNADTQYHPNYVEPTIANSIPIINNEAPKK